jgi:glycosyltransferase involved in cell wall biosynthesis
MKLSVIICTHNPRADFLNRTLESLKNQIIDQSLWEFLLIDNASKDSLSCSWDLSWHPNSRHIRENEIGLTPARLRGIREAEGELLLFVDDDNVLANDYLAKCIDISERIPALGCFGSGSLVPEYEEKPADELLPYTIALALRSVSKPRWSNIPEDPSTPWGAGICVSKVVAKHYHDAVVQSHLQKSLGRKGAILTSGEDIEISWQACSIGMGRGIFPELQITHLIDSRRVQKNYLLQIVKGHSYSQVMLDYMHGNLNLTLERAPSFFLVIKSIFMISPMNFFHEGLRWWKYLKMSPTQREFDEVSRCGANDARININNMIGSK